MRRPEYRDPWHYGEQLSPQPDPSLVVGRVRSDPVCEHRGPSGYCTRLAVTAALLPSADPNRPASYRSRCAEHGEDGPKVCVGCKRLNSSGDPYHCEHCANRWREGSAADREAAR